MASGVFHCWTIGSEGAPLVPAAVIWAAGPSREPDRKTHDRIEVCPPPAGTPSSVICPSRSTIGLTYRETAVPRGNSTVSKPQRGAGGGAGDSSGTQAGPTRGP